MNIVLAGIISILHSPNQRLFLSGKVPHPLPSGLYKGLVNFRTSWQGKKFDASKSSGINLISGKKNILLKLILGKAWLII